MLFKSHKLSNNDLDFNSFLEITRFRFAWNILVALSILAVFNSILFLFIRIDYVLYIAPAALFTTGSVLYMHYSQKYKTVSKIFTVFGFLSISMTLLTIWNDPLLSTFLYIIIVIIFTFFTLEKIWGIVSSLAYLLVCTYYVLFNYSDNVQNTPPLNTIDAIQYAAEFAACFLGIIYMLYLFLLTNKYAQKQLKTINNKLESQNKLISEQNEEIIIKSRHKEEFLSNMSHEIRTPLNAVIGYSDLMFKQPLSGKQNDYMTNIRIASKSLLALINDVLDYAKIEAGKIKIESEDFDLHQSLHHIISMMNVQALEKNLELILELKDDVPQFISSDVNRLLQVFTNLIGNAIKFTSDGYVKLEVSTVFRDDKRCEIKFSVKDSGIGISADKHQLIFEKFSQVDSLITRQFEGTGLGLAISSRIVELLGGELKVKSNLDEGSDFYFSILVDIPNITELTNNSESIIHVEGIENINILLADDNLVNRMVAQEALLDWNENIKVATVVDGMEAIEYLSNHPCDIILMDIHMPNLNGLEATKYIRNELNNTIPIIALTASILSSGTEECYNAGMNDVIMKPFKVEDVIRKIAIHLNLEIKYT